MFKQLVVGFMQKLNAAWWVEITTTAPSCIYYFGPFQNNAEAKAAFPGYVEDIDGEGAQGVVVVIKRCNPDNLTICDDV